MGLLLGIDAGTTSLKVGVFDADGRALAVAGEEYRLETPEAAVEREAFIRRVASRLSGA